MAGLKMFRPTPPGICLTTATENIPANIRAQKGTPAGRQSASSTPVTRPLPSKTRWPRSRLPISSHRPQVTTETRITQSARQPKFHTPPILMGRQAINTSSITSRLESPRRIWGAAFCKVGFIARPPFSWLSAGSAAGRCPVPATPAPRETAWRGRRKSSCRRRCTAGRCNRRRCPDVRR